MTVAIVPASAVQPSRRASTGAGRAATRFRRRAPPGRTARRPWGHSPNLAVKNTPEFQGHACQAASEAAAIVRAAASRNPEPGRAPGLRCGAKPPQLGVGQGEDQQRGDEPHDAELGGPQGGCEACPHLIRAEAADVVGQRLDEQHERGQRHAQPQQPAAGKPADPPGGPQIAARTSPRARTAGRARTWRRLRPGRTAPSTTAPRPCARRSTSRRSRLGSRWRCAPQSRRRPRAPADCRPTALAVGSQPWCRAMRP